MTFKKTKLVLGIATATLTLAGAIASPEAFAHKKTSKSKTYKVQKSVVSSSDSRVSALQSQVNDLASTVRSLQAQLANKGDGSSAKVQELDQWMASVKAAPVKIETKDNMVFFRGGFAHSNTHRDGVSIASDVVGTGNEAAGGGNWDQRADKNAWYFGAGFDFSLDDNLFGLMDDTEVLAELMFEYKELGNKVQGNALATNPTPLVVAGGTPRNIMVTEFTLAASPKIKFLKGNDFRPWIIPVGFNMNVISPPSESITVLQPGMMFGLGADYKLWKNIYVGADARYHYAIGKLDGVNTDGYTAGGYLGDRKSVV